MQLIIGGIESRTDAGSLGVNDYILHSSPSQLKIFPATVLLGST